MRVERLGLGLSSRDYSHIGINSTVKDILIESTSR
jgi:hypothetical protein